MKGSRTQIKTNENTVLTINDGGHGQDNTIAVIDNRVHRLVFDDRKIMLQVVV